MKKIFLIYILLILVFTEGLAQVKISDMTADTDPDSSDTFLSITDSSGSWTNRKMTWYTLHNWLGYDQNGNLTNSAFPTSLTLSNKTLTFNNNSTVNITSSDFNVDGNSTFDLYGTFTGVTGSKFLVSPKTTITDYRHLGYVGSDGTSLLTYNYGTSLTDTITSYRWLRNTFDGSVDLAPQSIVLNNLSTALVNYINAAGGGTITNNPDDITLYNVTDTTIGIKQTWLNAYNGAQISDSISARLQASGDTTLIYNPGNVTPAEVVIGRKSRDTVALAPVRFGDDVTTDSTVHNKGGIKVGINGTLIDSIKTTSLMDELRIYVTTSDDTLRFFSSTGDSLELWVKHLRYAAPLSLPLTTVSGNLKYASIPHDGREFRIDFASGTNHPDSLQTSGVKNLWYAANLFHKDSNAVKPMEYGDLEDSLQIISKWTARSNTTWGMENIVIGTDRDPNSTKAVWVTGNSTTTDRVGSLTNYFTIDSGATYSVFCLVKESGGASKYAIQIKDSISGYLYYDYQNTTGTADLTSWTEIGGTEADTFQTSQQMIKFPRSRGFELATTEWTTTGNHTGTLTGEDVYEGYGAWLMTATGAGDNTANYGYLPSTAYSSLTVGNNYTFSFFAAMGTSPEIDSIKLMFQFGDIQDTFYVKSFFQYFSTSFVATASTTGDIKLWLGEAFSVVFDNMSLIYNSPARTVYALIQCTGQVDEDTIFADNFMIRKNGTPWGWNQPGDAIIISGNFTGDSLNLDGRYVSGNRYKPLAITSKVGTVALIDGGWTVDNPVITNNVQGVAVSDIKVQKGLKQGIRLAMTPPTQDGYFWVSRCRLDSIGTGVSWIQGNLIQTLSGTGLGINCRGNYVSITNNHIVTTWNDAFNVVGTNLTFRNNYAYDVAWSPIGDGLHWTYASDGIIENNYIQSHRSRFADSLYDHKANLNLNAGTGGRDYLVRNNTLIGFSGGIGGSGTYTRIYNNYISNCKPTDHTLWGSDTTITGTLTGGNAIATLGDSCDIYNNIVDSSFTALQIKRQGRIRVYNNTFKNFGWNSTKNAYFSAVTAYGLKGNVTWTDSDSLFLRNNIFSTDSSAEVNISNTVLIGALNNNLYDGVTFDVLGQTTFVGIQGLGYETSGINSDPVFEYNYRLARTSPAKNAGTTGITDRDYYSNSIVSTRDLGAIERQ